MQSSPKYAANFFFSGLAVDVDPEMLDQKTGAYLEAHCMQMSRLAKNKLQVMRGDKSFFIGSLPSGTTTATIYFIGGIWVAGYIIVLYRDSGTDLTYIYCNGTIIGTHKEYPNTFCDIDSNDESLELVITDNSTVPIVLNIQDMLDHKLDQTYFDDYDVKKYSVNKTIQLNQPVFVQLEDLGAGGGLKVGSYAYAMCYSSKNNESTPWSPISPYIPVPESAVSLLSNAVEPYAAGLKTWGGETSSTPGRYGIRLKLRITNLSGFDYIKLKRIANNTGQPISYTPIAEFLIVGTDAFGSLIDIQTDPYSIIEFVDSDTRDWAILDDSVTQAYSTIKTARTARFYDRRIILGGIEYESKLISDDNKSDMFLTELGVNRIALPIVKLLETGKLAGGFSSIYNQVYNKSHRLGEKYGFGIKLNDEQGNTLFTVPVKHGEDLKDDFTNFQFPNRRDAIPTGVKRVDTITLDGTIGSATILCTTVSGIAVFHTSLAITAQEFVTKYAADYLVEDTTVTAYQNKLIFTSTIAGQDFVGVTSITTAGAGDLNGSVTTPQANVIPTRQADKILFGDTAGDAYITVTVSGISVTRTAISTGIAMDAAIAFAADSDVIAGFAAIGVVASVTSEGYGGVILTGPIAGTAMTTTASGTLVLATDAVIHSVLSVLGRQRIDTITFSPVTGTIGTAYITCHGITKPMVWDRTWYNTTDTFITTYGADYLPIVVSTELFTNKLIFTGSFSEETTVASFSGGDLFGTIYPTQPNAEGVNQIDTLTLTGTSGNVIITCGGLPRGITLINSLTDTATKFFTDYQFSYAAIGIDILNSGETIIFTALDAGSGFSTSIVNTTDNLTGSAVITQTAATPVAQIDTVTLLGTSGTANITCEGLTHSITFSISQDITAINFYNNFHAEYLSSKGVTVGYSGGTITFTGPADGTVITTTATGDLVDNIYTVTSPAAGTSQIDKVTVGGSSGNITITCDGLTRGISYQTSPTITASAFVSDYYETYRDLRDIEVTSSGADLFFRALVPGDGFVTTSTQVLSDLDSLNGIEYTRANGAGTSEAAFSTGKYEDSTVASYAGEDVDYVYDPVRARRLRKLDTDKELNIVSVADPTGGLVKPYSPITPVGRGSRPNQNTYDDIIQMNIMDTVETVDNRVYQYGKYISTVGLRLGGVDVTKLPDNVKSFSVVRTPAAGRVVCQGIGMYALTEQVGDAPSLVKAPNKLWFYSPEIDPVIGNKGGVYEDIKANPDAYQIQLVAPCGFFSDFYNSISYGHEQQQDFVSMPICGAGANARPMFPPDAAATNYISFGKWRNVTLQGNGLVNSDLTFIITAAQDVPHAKVRVPYLELSLSTNIYANANVLPEASSTPQSKEFHEPWYIINIIQNKSVPNNNINSYNDIGHSIRLESILGLSTGEASQTFPLVEERPEDVYSLNDTATTYRYIWVDGLPWLDSNNLTNIVTYLILLEATGEFTPTGGLKCYGIYTYDDALNVITFDQVLPTSLAPVVPVKGLQIVIKYNSNSPVEVFLGDTYVADATFLAVDVANPGMPEFRMKAPMPHYAFDFKTTYHQAVNPEAGITHANIFEDQGAHTVGDVRQWLISFTCESTVNLPLAYKNFFPNRLYVMRPSYCPNVRLGTETLAEFFTRMNIYLEYNDDYPDEYLNWHYGGLSTLSSVNYDYEKLLPLKSYAEPQSGANELLSLMKRFHWTTQSKPGYTSNKVFIPTNIYDLKNDKASQISILYDDFSERGSNLYVITDRGAGMLLTDKQMITTAEGNNLTILANDASLIKGEVWLNSSIGCPKEFWRGKSEGSIKLPNNIVANILVFPSQDDIVMLSNNSFVQIADNNRKAVVDSLELIDLTGDFVTKLYSVIDQGENKLWITIGLTTYAFNFDQNNWDGSVKSISFDKSFNAKYLTGWDDRNVLAHALNKTGQFGVSISHKHSDRFSAIGDDPYVVFSVTPGLGRAYAFLDMFISAMYKPSSVEVAMDKLFTDSVVIPDTKIVTYNDGWHYIQGLPRTAVGGRALIGKTLFVKVRFAGTSVPYDLRFVKTGYREIIGG